MEHRSVKYQVREIGPAGWVWIILPDDEIPIMSPIRLATREHAVAVCIQEIDIWTERAPKV